MAPKLPLPNLGPRARLILKWVGYVVLAFVTFVFALQLTFPYDRVKDKVVEALSTKYDVTIASVERGIVPGRLFFNSVTLRTRPAKADEVASTFIIKRIEVDLGILALLGATASVDLDAEIGPGRIKGSIAISKSRTEIDIEGTGLPSGMLPMRELIGLPMSGKIGFSAKLALPNEKQKSGKMIANWQKARGAFGFTCPNNCTIGDGTTKLKPKLKNSRQQAFAADGIDFGKVNVDSLLAHVTIKDGILELDKFDTKSQDGEIHVDFQATLAPQLDDSMVAGCLRFKGSDLLRQKEPKTHAALSTTGANLGPDNLFHIRLDGKLKEMKRLAQTCGPTLKGGSMDDPANPSNNNTGTVRPTITVQPAEDKDKPAPGSGSGAVTPPNAEAPSSFKANAGSLNPPPPASPDTGSNNGTGTGSAPTPPGPVNEHNNGHDPGPENQGVTPTPPGEPLPPGEQPGSAEPLPPPAQ